MFKKLYTFIHSTYVPIVRLENHFWHIFMALFVENHALPGDISLAKRSAIPDKQCYLM